MPADQAPGQIRAHVAEFGDGDQIQDIKLPTDDSARCAGRKIKNFRREIEKPKHVKQTEQRVSHRSQRFIMPQASEHLTSEHGQQKKKNDR